VVTERGERVIVLAKAFCTKYNYPYHYPYVWDKGTRRGRGMVVLDNPFGLQSKKS